MTKSMLSLMPAAKLYGNRWLANLLRRKWATWLVVGDYPADSSGDTEGLELGEVRWVLVETE